MRLCSSILCVHMFHLQNYWMDVSEICYWEFTLKVVWQTLLFWPILVQCNLYMKLNSNFDFVKNSSSYRKLVYGIKVKISLKYTTLFQTFFSNETKQFMTLSRVVSIVWCFNSTVTSAGNEYQSRWDMQNHKDHIWKISVPHWSTPSHS